MEELGLQGQLGMRSNLITRTKLSDQAHQYVGIPIQMDRMHLEVHPHFLGLLPYFMGGMQDPAKEIYMD